ncbi:MAG: GatB/YqeY domain-containing protein [Pseudomonadota bacterium]
MSAIQQAIAEATKTAMKSREKERVAVLRMVNAEFKRVEVDERRELGDADVLAILNKMMKQRQDAHSQYTDAGREDLAAQEAMEMALIQEFLPEPLSDAELDALIAKCISDAGAQGMQDMGKVMGLVKQAAEGRADMGKVSGRVKSQLA